MDHITYVIEPKEAETMANNLGHKTVLDLLPTLAKSAQKLARVPISLFPVGAVGLSTDGRIFIGVNVEFPGLPLHHSIHAEQFLITNLSLHPGTQLQNVVVSAYPCGHCRQFLQEIRNAHDIQIYVLSMEDDEKENVQNGGISFKPLSYFLPHRFGPFDLLDKGAPLMLETQHNSLVLVETREYNIENNNICNGFTQFKDKLVLAALEAANRSHAPYSKCPSGVALVDDKGNIYKGSYMESAAYNPSLGPAQVAVIAYLAAAGSERSYDKIVGAVLVEMEGEVKVKQEETVRMFFKAVAPKCEVFVSLCKLGKGAN